MSADPHSEGGTDERAAIAAVPKHLLIGGEWRDATGGATFEVEDPSTGESLCRVADATPEDGLAALTAAADAQRAWAAHPPRARGEILSRAYQMLLDRQDELALVMTLEMGKPLPDARAEIAYAAEFFRWFAEEAVRIEGGYAVSPDGQSRFIIHRQPVGPCLLITPWNFPMAMGTRKIGPAVAAGCTMVVKPAPETPLSMLALAAILQEAGLPEGVLNVITTNHAAEVMGPLIRDQRSRKLSFTGSTAVGRLLLEQCAATIKRTSMELGGNAPFIVFEDADLDAAVDGALIAKMRNIGEACTAANRFYVHAQVADEFSRRLADRMSAMRIGRGVEEGVQVGPLINAEARAKVQGLVDDALAHGAKALIGGSAISGPGYFYQPTVLTQVPAQARMSREEIFGPVAPVMTFEQEEEAIAAANDTEFGLVSYVYTRDLARGIRVSEALESGMVGLNRGMVSTPAAPFGGVKQSGIGREGGRLGIEEFLEVKYINVAVS
ncbi:MAG TPA: NAD-dependent succinate-semialdehyde dehydrogenase [Actinopolymorphaceae bacterium]|jgi:succinate-semialdehyde dehydrogenase/glutarate-semialdehyde dehydrogenase